MTKKWYQKRPKWWFDLLNLFEMSEKKYFTWFKATLCIIILAEPLKWLLDIPVMPKLLLCVIAISPFVPFGVQYVRLYIQALPRSITKMILTTGSLPLAIDVTAAILSPFLFVFVLVLYYIRSKSSHH